MTVQAQHKWTAAAFLEWSAVQVDHRFELERGRLLEMAPEQARHARTKFAVAKALDRAILEAGLECYVFPDGMMVAIDESTVRIPDAAVQCAPYDPEATVLSEPIILVEVVSPSSGSRDENFKLVEYFSLVSVAHYLVLVPERRSVIHFRRPAEAGKIETRIVESGLVDLSPPGLSIRVEELFGEAAQ